jgi:hypothetical protein
MPSPWQSCLAGSSFFVTWFPVDAWLLVLDFLLECARVVVHVVLRLRNLRFLLFHPKYVDRKVHVNFFARMICNNHSAFLHYCQMELRVGSTKDLQQTSGKVPIAIGILSHLAIGNIISIDNRCVRRTDDGLLITPQHSCQHSFVVHTLLSTRNL